MQPDTPAAAGVPKGTSGTPAGVIASALVDAGLGLAVYLPDSVLYEAEQALEAHEGIDTLVCAREDEGVAIAVGSGLAGQPAAVLMEGSGIGYAGLILARAQQQRTPVLVLASHSLLLDERFDYHAASRLAGEGILSGLGIPYATISDIAAARRTIIGAVTTMLGQKTPVGLLVAPGAMGVT